MLAYLSRHLDPGESLAEVLFGLIMTLTFTLGAGLIVQAGPDAVRELLIATIGCNIAWGVIDGALYITGQVFERARLRKLSDTMRASPSEQAAAAIAADELADLLGEVSDPGERQDICLRMARVVRASKPRPVEFKAADLKGAVASFWLVFLASLPAALPFALLDDAQVALRTSNAVLIASLFVVGFYWARHAALRPWLTGLTMMVGGMAMVAVAIALGG